LFGGSSIKGFAFAMTVGVVVGTYSSIFIASPILVDFAMGGKKIKANSNTPDQKVKNAPATTPLKVK
ncbi:MAG: hypothetical protein WBB93_13545, partial [Saprospiraceae bacterium]